MDDLGMLNKIENMVRRYLYPSKYDVEDIAVKIWTELFEKQKYLSYLYVRNRCIDEIRRGNKVKFCPLEEFKNLPAPKEESSDAKEILNILMENSALSSTDRELIYLAFYKGEKVPTFLLDKIIIRLRKELDLMIKAKGNQSNGKRTF